MPEDSDLLLIRKIRDTGPDAPDRATKIELLRTLRGRSPAAATMADEYLLTDLERLRQGLESAQANSREARLLLEQLTAPPWHVGVYLGLRQVAGNDSAALVATGPGRRVVHFADGLDAAEFGVGDEVLLSTEQHLIVARSSDGAISSGETATFDRTVDGRRIVIRAQGDEFVVTATDALLSASPRAGDLVRWDRNLWLAFEPVPRSVGASLFLDETPDDSFESVGGLDTQIAELQRTIRMHYAHGDVVRKYGLRRRTAVLLTGPPGTGKTLLARALANWLASLSASGRSRFMNIKPGSLHSMWYSQSEANYREAFRAAREAGEREPDVPVVLFFDEIDAIGGARGDALTRVDDRVLTAFLTELDGIESRGNVLVVCATNRRDALDPALLRPGGRLGDIVLEVPRPDRRAAREIFLRHIPREIPLARTEPSAQRETLIDSAVARIYGPNGRGELASLTFRDGKRRAVTAADLVSGAVIANISRRAIERACLRDVETAVAGLRLTDLLDAVDTEFDVAVRGLTAFNCRRLIEGLPQDVDVVRVERPSRPSRPVYRYLAVS